MAIAAVFITAVVFCATVYSTHAVQGIICLVPRSLEKNAVNKIYLSLYEIGSAGSISISLQNMDTDKVIAQTIIDVESDETEKVVEMHVPETQEYRARIWVNGTFDNYNFTEQEELYLHSVNPTVVFIQTDKPLYKPGQTVKFRTLVTDRYLRPLGDDSQLAEVYAEDPSGSRIAQWKNVSFGGGIRQFEFPLSEEPPLGLWKISLVQPDNRIEAQHFTVEEYVLPKFEVVVKPPSFVMADAEEVPVEICARYTYGKGVQGSVKINSSLESYSWSSEKFPVVEFEDKIDGCLTYNINISLIDKEFHYSYRRIQVIAQVTEDGTGVQRNGSVDIQRTQNALTLEFLDDDYKQYFKPGIPYRKKIKATKPDDTPAPNEDIEICATISRQRILQQWWAQRKVKYCKNYTTDEDGIVVFQVPPQKTDTISLHLDAKSVKYGTTSVPGRPRIYQPQTSTSVQPYFSPSKSYIQIENIDDRLPCGTSRKVKILYTTQEGASYTFYYQVISKGRIIEKGSKEVTYSSANNIATSMCRDSLSVNDVRILLVPSTTETGNDTDEDIDCSAGPIGETEITINVAGALSPSMRLLVYYVRDDDETVADSSKFLVEKCFQNKVEFQFGDEEKQPGTKTSVTLKASPNSLCGTKVLDKSITLLDSTDPLTKERIFQELQKFDQQQYYQRNHCNDKYRKGGRNKMSQSMILPPRPWSSSQHADALTAFEDAGMAVLSDFKMLNRPCSKSQSGYDSGYGGFALASVGVRGGAPIAAARPVTTQAAPAVAFTADNEDTYSGGVRKSAVSAKSAVDVRTYFPETWLFEMETVGESGELIGKAVLPHSITEWIGSAVCINEADGLGLSNTARITAFQSFFIELTLPYSVIRGEKVPLTTSIFNYLDKCLPITRKINVVVISDNGTMASETSASEDVCVCGGKTETYRFMFTPDTVGSLNLTVSAESAESSTVCGDQETAGVVARDMLTKSLRVEAEGFKQERVSSFLFCPEDYEGSTYTNKLDLTTPENAVDGSQRAFISFSGDIMGPAIDNLDRLVQLPTGCGEQNMVRFTPNIVALDYLTNIGKLTEEIRNRAISNLQSGYQNELKYRHSDGSFSAFGISDREGSMWLTAFVLRSFSEAEKYISIDKVDMLRTRNWIVEKQQADGCFPKIGKMFSESMKGGVGSQAALTSYVLASLIVSGVRNESVVNGAMTCIGKDTELTPYTAALYAYSSALAGNDPETDRFLTYLDSKEIREGDEIYWRNVNGTKSLNIETAAYAVMAILKRKGDSGLSKALSVVRHMTKMRNSYGGFASTQDTVVGLQAIALFASIINQDPVDLTIEVKGGMLEKTVTITEEDKLLVKKSRVPVVPSTVDVVAKGAGCGLLQASVRYNTLEIPKQQFFSLTVKAERKENCKKAEIQACVQYLPEGKRSNMALLEIRMTSGFAAIKESLEKLLSDIRQYIKRYEMDNNNVVIYFDELTNENVCFAFDVEEVISVEDAKPATAKLYDYYAKEKEESTDYRISGSC